MNCWNCWIVCVLLLLLPSASSLRADGGTIRLSERQGGYRITVFTAPTPFRAGPVDVSVLVQDARTGQPVPEARVTVRAVPCGRPGSAITARATVEAATNKLFRAAVVDLPEPGWWEIEVVVEGTRGRAQARFEVEAAEAAPRWLDLWPWICWPALAVVLFGIHQVLVRRKGRERRPERAGDGATQGSTTPPPARAPDRQPGPSVSLPGDQGTQEPAAPAG
jgi:hypothetical protein